MANLTESSIWEAGVFQLETTTPVLGGASGPSNTQAKQLANRTRYLYDSIVNAGLTGQAVEYSGDLNSATKPGLYLVRSSATNLPVSGLGHMVVTGREVVPEAGNVAARVQLFLSQQTSDIYFRFAAGTSWGSWKKLVLDATLAAFQQMFVGSVSYFATNTAPNGWFECNGAAVSRTTYATLFARIGTTFGAGNGTTTFNIPDLRGEFIRGWDNGRGTADVGRVFGSFQAQAFQAHTHSATALTPVTVQSGTGATAVNSSGSTTTGSTGDSPDDTRPRNVALLLCIKY